MTNSKQYYNKKWLTLSNIIIRNDYSNDNYDIKSYLNFTIQ